MSHLGAVSPKFKKKQTKSLRQVTTKVHSPLEDDLPVDNASKQLVLHNEASSNPGQGASDLIESYPRSSQSSVASSASNPSPRVVPYVGHFTVQCSECLKWRLIPTKEKYEEIREKISKIPFLCARAREWRPDVSCDDPADIYQDGSRLWAIDKPDISQAPPGWERLLRIRAEGGSRFADIYYVTPSGKKLRSMVEVERYLREQPEYARDGVNISQFSFLIPRPLQDNFVRKHSATPNMNKPTPLEPYEGMCFHAFLDAEKPLLQKLNYNKGALMQTDRNKNKILQILQPVTVIIKNRKQIPARTVSDAQRTRSIGMNLLFLLRWFIHSHGWIFGLYVRMSTCCLLILQCINVGL